MEHLYNPDPNITVKGAGVILWGVGWVLFAALWIHCNDLVRRKGYGQSGESQYLQQ